MKQGKFGLCLAFYAVLAFVLALLKQPLLCGLLLGFVLLAEGDKWTVRQVLQGFILSLASTFFLETAYTLVSFIVPHSIGFFYDFIYGVFRIVSVLAYAGLLVLCVIAILRVCRDQDANIPLLSGLAYRILGEQKPRPVKQQPVFPQAPYGQPVQYPPQHQPPVQNGFPVQQGQQGMPPMQQMQGYPMPPQQGMQAAPPAVVPDAQSGSMPQPPAVEPPQPPQQQ